MMTNQQRLALKTIRDEKTKLHAQLDGFAAERKVVKRTLHAIEEYAAMVGRKDRCLELCVDLLGGSILRFTYDRKIDGELIWDRIERLTEQEEEIRREAKTAARERKPWRPDREDAKKGKKGKGKR